MRSQFITIEGVAGSGKTSLLHAIEPQLIDPFRDDLVFTREPGGSKTAEAIRQIVLGPEYTDMDPMTEALLFAAARRQHLKDTVLPAIDAGKTVISDRYVDSSIVYQGAGRNLGVDNVIAINQFAINDFWPDLTIYLDLDPQIGLARIQNRPVDDRLDSDQLDFHKRVRDAYLYLIDKNPQRFIKIDANQSEKTVQNEVLDIITERLNS